MQKEQNKATGTAVKNENLATEGSIKPAQKAQSNVVSEIAKTYKVNQRLNP